MAVIAAVPTLRDRFFDGTKKLVRNVEHMVIGTSENTGIAAGMDDRLLKFMVSGFFKGLTMDINFSVDTVMISDPGQDQDDEMSMVLLRSLTERGLINCRGVIANLQPAYDRARLARGTLDALGCDMIPVAVGTDGGSDRHTDTFSTTAGEYMPETLDVHDMPSMTGQELLLHIYETANVVGAPTLS